MRVELFALDSTSIKVHPDAAGALKNGPQSIGKSRGGWNTKLHLVAADACTAVNFRLSPGNAHDAPQGRELSRGLGVMPLLMAAPTRTTKPGRSRGMMPVVPPKRTRRNPWPHDRQLHRRRNEIERLFRRLKVYRRVLTRFDKLDALYLGFLCFALIVEALRLC